MRPGTEPDGVSFQRAFLRRAEAEAAEAAWWTEEGFDMSWLWSVYLGRSGMFLDVLKIFFLIGLEKKLIREVL